MEQNERFETIAREIDQWVADGAVPGAAITIRFRGETVAEHMVGEAHPGIPMRPATLFGLASVTKPVAAATVVSCAEDGLFSLDDPVARLVPEFLTDVDSSVEGFDPALEEQRASITVRQLLAHTSGLPEDLPASYLNFRALPDLETWTDAMLRMPLKAAPGSTLRYSNVGFALLGRLVEHATRNDFWDETRTRILDPLGLDEIVPRPSGSAVERIADVQDAARSGSPSAAYNSAWWRETAIPWGGIYGSTRHLARFAELFLPGRAETSVLTEDACLAMRTDQANGVSGGVESLRVQWQRAYWGLGWEVRGDKPKHWTGDLASPGTFCHFGAAGTLLWADPDRDLVVAVFANRTVAHRWPFAPPRWTRLNNAIIEAADELRD
ncbi:MAG: beta-lactamase family protein [Thermomicrobiales bacterium]|nr:beta-lactamase family protein [Thermomicrobiales bacterium]